MFVDYDDRFWLNGNYSVYPEPSEKACMEVARTPEGYLVGNEKVHSRKLDAFMVATEARKE
jgi:hypothetical protein